MSSQRILRINQLIKQEVAETLYRVMNDTGFDMAAVTVTRVQTSNDLRHARVYVSIRGDEAAQERMLHQICRHRGEIRAAVGKHVVIKYTPHISFELDKSIALGSQVLDTIFRIEQEHPEWKDTPPIPEPLPGEEQDES